MNCRLFGAASAEGAESCPVCGADFDALCTGVASSASLQSDGSVVCSPAVQSSGIEEELAWRKERMRRNGLISGAVSLAGALLIGSGLILSPDLPLTAAILLTVQCVVMFFSGFWAMLSSADAFARSSMPSVAKVLVVIVAAPLVITLGFLLGWVLLVIQWRKVKKLEKAARVSRLAWCWLRRGLWLKEKEACCSWWSA